MIISIRIPFCTQWPVQAAADHTSHGGLEGKFFSEVDKNYGVQAIQYL